MIVDSGEIVRFSRSAKNHLATMLQKSPPAVSAKPDLSLKKRSGPIG
jgi:hypothetical protein